MLLQHSRQVFRLFGLFGVLILTFVLTQGCETEKPQPGTCTSSKDCGTGKFCYRGKCRRRACQANEDCSDGKICKEGSCVAGSVTTETVDQKDAGTETTPTETTQPDNTVAEGTTEQPPAGPCKGQKECTSDAACSGDKCLGGCCLPKCDGKPCPTGFKCKEDTKQCVICLADGDCPILGQTCNKDKGTCGEAVQCPGGKKPDANGKCPKICGNAKCKAGETPDPKDNCKCIPKVDVCNPCTKDAECGIGNHCTEDIQKKKFCAIDCTATSKCDPGYQCLSLGDYSVCMPTSGYCPCLGVTCKKPGYKCCKSRGGCAQCCDNSDCKKDEVCRADGTCGSSDPCKGVTCKTGQQCNSATGACGCASPCPTGTCCSSSDNACTASACSTNPPPAKCNPACTGGQKCCPPPFPGLPGTCAAQCQGTGAGGCSSNADCKKPGEVCCKGLKMCMSALIATTLLKSLCVGGNSQDKCQSDADCPTGKSCKGGALGGPKSCQ